MTCASCVATVQKALAAVPGVTHVQVDLKSKQATVLVEINRFDQKALLTALEKVGYPGKMLK
jgi:Cu+-exporting ATPase